MPLKLCVKHENKVEKSLKMNVTKELKITLELKKKDAIDFCYFSWEK